MGSLLARLRIVYKTLLPVMILALVAIAGVGFSQWTAQRSQLGLQTVLDVQARAALLATRANVLLVDFVHVAWRAVAQSDMDAKKSVAASLAGLKATVDARFTEVAAIVPDAEHKAKVDAILALFSGMGAMAQQAASLNIAGNEAAALAMLNQAFQPTSQHVREQSAALTALLVAEAEASSAAIEASAKRQALLTWGAAGAGVLLAVVLGVAISLSGVTRPLLRLKAAMDRLAGGERDLAIPGTDRRDELGDMARSVSVFAEGLRETERLKTEQEAIKARLEAERRTAMISLAGGFEASVGAVVGAISEAASNLNGAAGAMSGVAERTTRQAQEVAMTAGQASANVATVASAAEELSASVREIAQQVASSARIAGDAVSESERANQTVAELSVAASRIGDVVRLIGDIAGQTNLLALNATIEAARAGEAGKGFAVVASEVKSLAAQTAKATEEIGGQIGAMQAATGQAVQAIGGIGGTITRMSEIAAAIAAAVEEQGAATAEIARNVSDAAAGTDRVSGTIGEVTQSAHETGAAAAEVKTTATALSGESDRLRAEVTRFLAGVRAA